MMRSLLLFLVCSLLLAAKVHYAKVEPYESVTLKAAVSGLVLDVDLEAEGTFVKEARIVRLDDRLEKKDLNVTTESLALIKQMLKINEESAASLAETVSRQKGYYDRISRLSTASKTQKDNAYSAYSSIKTQYLATKEKIVSLRKQLLDMQYKQAMLEDTITKKSLMLKNKYLYSLLVRAGDFVAAGTPMARVDDVHQAKLVLYLEPEELSDLQKKTVYIDGKKTSYHVGKVWRVADEKYISSYRAEIYVDTPKRHFSQLVKVELK